MSYNRRKSRNNLVGDFSSPKSKNLDPFARDPFKIQSYNFHYADRPTFSIAAPPQINRLTANTTAKRFETYYYNYDFGPSRYDKENLPTKSNNSKFHETRRRKFLYDQPKSSLGYGTSNNNNNTQTIHGRYPTLISGTTNIGQSQQQQHGNAMGNSISINLSSGQGPGQVCKSTPSPLFRANSNREYMSGIRTIYAASGNAGNRKSSGFYQQSSLGNNCQPRSRTSLLNMESAGGGRRMYGEQGSHNSLTAIATKDRINLQISTSQHNRKPMEGTVLVHKKNLADNGGLLDRQTSMSGCQININIKGLDDNILNENVTINIESDAADKHKANDGTDANIERNLISKSYVTDKMRTNENNDSHGTFVIDKHISKFSVRRRDSRDGLNNPQSYEAERESYERDHEMAKQRQRDREREMEHEREREHERMKERERERELERARDRERLYESAKERERERERMREREREHDYELSRKRSHKWESPLARSRSKQELHNKNSTTSIELKRTTKNLNSSSHERIPALVSWRNEKNFRGTGIPLGKATTNTMPTGERSHVGGYLNPANNYRRNNTNYTNDALLKDYQRLRSNQGGIGGSVAPNPTKQTKQNNLAYEREKPNNISNAANRKLPERKLLNNLPLNHRIESFTTTIPSQTRRMSSLHSLHNFKTSNNNGENTRVGCSGGGATINLPPRRSSDINLRRSAHTSSGTNLTKSPVNVNINVYTDKLRLLRV